MKGRNLTSGFFSLLWVLIQLLYHVVSYAMAECRWNLGRMLRKILTCVPAKSAEGELPRIRKVSAGLKKTGRKFPQHVAFVVLPKEELSPSRALVANVKWAFGQGEGKMVERSLPCREDVVNVEAVAKVVCWAWVADIPVISLYDVNGVLKCHWQKLYRRIHDELSHNLWVVQKQSTVLPKIEFHNVGDSKAKPKNGYTNGFSNGNGIHVEPQKTLHINLFCKKDGKEAIAEACKSLYSNYRDYGRVNLEKAVTEEIIDKELRQQLDFGHSSDCIMKTEPDLLVVLGKVNSTAGFLPWHIRLTEIHWLPSLRRVESSDFVNCLMKYAHCQQRFGT